MKRWFVMVALLLAALPAAAEQVNVKSFLPAPDAVAGWMLTGEPRQFTPKNLYEYIDGAADLFNSYGLVSAAAGDYQGAGDHHITVDIYDLGAPLHAFGIFASERAPDAKKLAVGVQGYSENGLTAFWQGPYYVKISQSDAGDQAAAIALAKATAAELPAGSGMPEELRRLPRANRVPDSEKYVRESALGHKFLTEDVSAEYRLDRLGKVTGELHVVDPGTPGKAAEAWRKLREFEAKTGAGPKTISGVGEAAFSAKDSSLGELVAARQGRFLMVGMSEKATRQEVAGLVGQAAKLAAGKLFEFDLPAPNLRQR